ncbi:MAG: hypothetical protein SVW77_01810, partial [Candidatus Nanohaloarchaea archaeon]|nr:hypothetical protein [Candidatus Nanohaloarchaea archaeon]
GDESDLDGYSARARAVLTNRAQARIEGRTGAVAHTELDSQAFTAQPDRPGDDIPVEEVAFFSQLAVERIVDDIDI